MTRPRLILLLAASLALGLLTTVASAIALGAFVDIPEYPPYLPSVSRTFIADGRAWYLNETHRFGITCAGWSPVTREFFTTPDPSTPVKNAIEKLTGSAPEDPSILLRDLRASDDPKLMESRGGGTYETRPLWGEFAIGHTPDVPPSKGPARTVGCDVGYGWPCPALWFQVRGLAANLKSWGGDVSGGRVVRGVASPVAFMSCRVIPARPAWMGLIINTALFSTLWLLLLVALRGLRQVNRRRNGLCPACAYDLRHTQPGQPCPECGRATNAI